NVEPYDVPFGRIEVYHEALSARDGVQRFLSRGKHTAMGYVGASEGKPVQTVTLDTILRRFEEVRFLKLDCEGAEWHARMHSQLLTRCEEIAAELHTTGPDDPRIAQVAKRFDELGFDGEASEQANHPGNWLLKARRGK